MDFAKLTKKANQEKFADAPLSLLRFVVLKLINCVCAFSIEHSHLFNSFTLFQDFGEETPALDVVKEHLRSQS